MTLQWRPIVRADSGEVFVETRWGSFRQAFQSARQWAVDFEGVRLQSSAGDEVDLDEVLETLRVVYSDNVLKITGITEILKIKT